jgi:RNA polymerase sigma factor (sigma-70 family)
MKIENLITEYRNTGSDQTFGEIYEMMASVVKVTNLRKYFGTVAKALRCGVDEVNELFDDTLMEAIAKFEDGREFERFFNRSWKNRRANLYKKHKRRRTREVYVDDSVEEEYNLFASVPDQTDIEQEVTTQHKKEADQRQLISFLIDNTDSTTTAIVDGFLGGGRTLRQVGKPLGLHPQQVSRMLRKLSDNHDPARYGDYEDYLLAQ